MTKWILPLLLMLPLMAGCYDHQPDDLEKLRIERARWQTLGLSSYRFQFQALCFCSQEFVQPAWVWVSGNTILSVHNVETGLPPPFDLQAWKTVDELFDIAEDAVLHADDYHIIYDNRYGFPSKIGFDYSRHVADDEITFIVSDLAAMRPFIRKD